MSATGPKPSCDTCRLVKVCAAFREAAALEKGFNASMEEQNIPDVVFFKATNLAQNCKNYESPIDVVKIADMGGK